MTETNIGCLFQVVKRDLMAGTRRESWESKVVNVEPELLMTKFLAADKESDEEKMQAILCGAVKLLRSQRPKPDAVLYLSLMYLAKTRPQAFMVNINDMVDWINSLVQISFFDNKFKQIWNFHPISIGFRMTSWSKPSVTFYERKHPHLLC